MLPDAADTASKNAATLLFDDAPLDAILYGESGGPSSADLFAATEDKRAAIGHAWQAGHTDEALCATQELLASGGVLTEREISAILTKIGGLVPDCAWPLLPPGAFPYETILQPIFDRAVRAGRDGLAGEVGLILARALEGHGQFVGSAAVFAPLLTGARLRGSQLEMAQNANNLGYVRSMQGCWREAEGLCEEAVAGFTAAGATSRANNAQANLLTARFELLGLPDAVELEPEILDVDAYYASENDWRRRKTLVLLARLREHAGDLDIALDLMEKSLRLTRKVPTQHRLAHSRELRGRRRVTTNRS